jgi:hypothetical protein
MVGLAEEIGILPLPVMIDFDSAIVRRHDLDILSAQHKPNSANGQQYAKQ